MPKKTNAAVNATTKREKFVDEKMSENSAKLKLDIYVLNIYILIASSIPTVLYMYRGYYTQKFIMVLLPRSLKG